MTSLADQTVLVTGANRGMGREYVAQLLDRGVTKVYAAARDPRTIDVVDPRAVALQLDVTDAASVAKAAEVASDVSVLINNAGIARGTSVLDRDTSDLRDHEGRRSRPRQAPPALCVRWQHRHPEIVDIVDRHNTATMGFLAKDREVEFREGPSFGWVRNTVVCLDTDLADMVISDRAYHYFPTVKSTTAVLLPHNEFKFIWTAAGQKTSPEEVAAAKQDDDGPMIVQGDATMGMIVASIYAGDWTDNPP